MEIKSPDISSERILVLARSQSHVSKSLIRNLSALGKVEVIVDQAGSEVASEDVVWVPDDEAEGFEHLMSAPQNFPLITAWSRAFVHLSRTLNEGEAVWFVEDDVAGDAESFRELVTGTAAVGADLSALKYESAEDNPEWVWFPTAEGFFERPWRSFNPLCRLSEKLIRKIFEFREEHGRVTFHEVLFASIATENSMSILNWQRDFRFKHLVANFRYRPVIEHPVQGVCHPVKDRELVDLMCDAPAPEFSRMGMARLSGYSILLEDYLFLCRFCRMVGIRKVVEFGPGDSTLAFRDAGCEVVSYEHDREWLEKAMDLIGGDSSVNLCFCDREEVPDDEQSAGEAELVFVDGPPQIRGDEMSRLRVCEWAMARHGGFILHDANRHSERKILEIFRKRGFEVWEIPTRKGLCLVFDRDRSAKLLKFAAERVPHLPCGEGLAWKILLGKSDEGRKVLGIGGDEGGPFVKAMRELFPNGESQFHHVVNAGRELPGKPSQDAMEIYVGKAVEVLSWMILSEDYRETFDMVWLDQEGSAFTRLSGACQVWSLLRPGGVLAFVSTKGIGDKYDDLVDCFLRALGNEGVVLLRGETCLVLKVESEPSTL